MLFDTHAHLDDRRFDKDRAELLQTLPEKGVRLLMNPGCDLPSSYAAAALARENSWIYAAVGSHPDPLPGKFQGEGHRGNRLGLSL